MKKGRALLWTMALLLTAALLCPAALADGEGEAPVYAAALADGQYEITVRSASPVFDVESARLTVRNGRMEVCLVLTGTEYGKLYPGTVEEAQAAKEEAYIHFEENGRGNYTYTFPLEALDKEMDCAVWSIFEERWYGGTLTFESGALPEEAYAKPVMLELFGLGDALVMTGVLALIFLLRHKPQKGQGRTAPGRNRRNGGGRRTSSRF